MMKKIISLLFMFQFIGSIGVSWAGYVIHGSTVVLETEFTKSDMLNALTILKNTESSLMTEITKFQNDISKNRSEQAILSDLLDYPFGPSLTIKPNREFSSDSFIHKPLAVDAAISTNSADYVKNLVKQIADNFGVANVNINQFTPAIFIVPATQPTVRVRNWDRNDPGGFNFPPLQDKWENVPLPDNFTAASGTDQEAVIYQPSTGKVWEFWKMQLVGAGSNITSSSCGLVGEWGARWGGRMDSVSTNPGYFLTEGGDWHTTTGVKYGTTATGLAFLGGIMTIEEQQRGVINHAIGISLVNVLNYPRWAFPANRSDGVTVSTNVLPEGARLRFPAGLDLDAINMHPYARMIAKAVQKYGMFVWDKAGAVSFRAENPANQYPAGNPYTKVGGILGCPNGASEPDCWADSHTYGNGGALRGFPFSQLQVLELEFN